MRKRRSVEEWKALFEAQEQSGLGIVAFCKHQGIAPAVWSRKKKELAGEVGGRACRFEPLARWEPGGEIRLEVGGVVIYTGLRGVEVLGQVVAAVGGGGRAWL